MRGKKAKAIRKKVYGDLSLRSEREYKKDNGTIINVGKRAEYQKAKRSQNNEVFLSQ
jgi:hypothetical protein